jgi:hypothetical protein
MRFPQDAEELLDLFTGSELRPLRASCMPQFADAMCRFRHVAPATEEAGIWSHSPASPSTASLAQAGRYPRGAAVDAGLSSFRLLASSDDR